MAFAAPLDDASTKTEQESPTQGEEWQMGVQSSLGSLKNNSDWMANLPKKLHNTPLSQLAIPGSHDSFAYTLDSSGELSPGEPDYLKILLTLFGSTARKMIYRWSITQSLDVKTQLAAGIRYFDLRIAAKKGCTDCFCVHGFYGIKVDEFLNDVDLFLKEHPKEIVFLDMNHLYELEEFAHKQLLSKILEVLGYKMCPYGNVDDVTLANLWENKFQVLVFYHNKVIHDYPQFWHGSAIPSPWPDTSNVEKLIKSLDVVYENRSKRPESFFVYQGILTPNAETIMKHPQGSLKDVLAAQVWTPFTQWIQSKRAGKCGINICIMNFVEMANYVQVILALNLKLAEEI